MSNLNSPAPVFNGVLLGQGVLFVICAIKEPDALPAMFLTSCAVWVLILSGMFIWAALADWRETWPWVRARRQQETLRWMAQLRRNGVSFSPKVEAELDQWEATR